MKKLWVIVVIILAFDFLETLTLNFATTIDKLQMDVTARTEELKTAEDRYSESLKNIALAVFSVDSRKGVEFSGGTEIDSADLLESILNTAGDYRGLVSNVETYFDTRKTYMQDIPCVWPVQYHELIRVTSGFGMRYSPLSGKISFHSGIDIAGWEAMPILATADGIVEHHFVPPGQIKGFTGHADLGGCVVIRHATGIRTVYGHLSKTTVNELGLRHVKRGDVIGYSGDTGKSKGDHLHYEVWDGPAWGGTLLNPYDFIKF